MGIGHQNLETNGFHYIGIDLINWFPGPDKLGQLVDIYFNNRLERVLTDLYAARLKFEQGH